MSNYKKLWLLLFVFISSQAFGEVDVGYIRSKLPIFRVYQEDWIEARIKSPQFEIVEIFNLGRGYDFYAENCAPKKGSEKLVGHFVLICSTQDRRWISEIRFDRMTNSKIIYLFEIVYITCGAGNWEVNKSMVIQKFGRPRLMQPKRLYYESPYESMWVEDNESVSRDYIDGLLCPSKNFISIKIYNTPNGKKLIQKAIQDWRYEKSSKNEIVF